MLLRAWVVFVFRSTYVHNKGFVSQVKAAFLANVSG